MNPAQAKGFCLKAEAILRPHGWHIGLTGSQLYGHPEPNRRKPSPDLDIIIYPHIFEDDQRPWGKPEQVLGLIGVKNAKHTAKAEVHEGSGYGTVHYIWIGKLKDGTKVDAFFLK